MRNRAATATRRITSATFHATYRDHPDPGAGKDLVLLDTREAEGGGDWSGHFVGTSFIFSHAANLNTLEGDPRFFFDDSQTPQAQGTGTEEWGGGGDYWGGRNMTLPFAGHPVGAPAVRKDAKNDEDKIESAYRFLLADLMPFGKNARITLEHGGTNESTEHYETVTYWYGLPAPSLVKTDELAIGDATARKPTRITRRTPPSPYEIDLPLRVGRRPRSTARRSTRPRRTAAARPRGTSEFTLQLDAGEPRRPAPPQARLPVPEPAGGGVRRRRGRRARSADWKPAGIWYLAGSNTCVYSNPKDELGATAAHRRRPRTAGSATTSS